MPSQLKVFLLPAKTVSKWRPPKSLLSRRISSGYQALQRLKLRWVEKLNVYVTCLLRRRQKNKLSGATFSFKRRLRKNVGKTKLITISFFTLIRKSLFTFVSFWWTAVHIRAQSVPLYRMWRNASVEIWLLKIFSPTSWLDNLGHKPFIPFQKKHIGP